MNETHRGVKTCNKGAGNSPKTKGKAFSENCRKAAAWRMTLMRLKR
jgi:hypothetical protein